MLRQKEKPQSEEKWLVLLTFDKEIYFFLQKSFQIFWWFQKSLYLCIRFETEIISKHNSII